MGRLVLGLLKGLLVGAVVGFGALKLGLGGGASAPLTPDELAQRLVWREAAAS